MRLSIVFFIHGCLALGKAGLDLRKKENEPELVVEEHDKINAVPYRWVPKEPARLDKPAEPINAVPYRWIPRPAQPPINAARGQREEIDSPFEHIRNLLVEDRKQPEIRQFHSKPRSYSCSCSYSRSSSSWSSSRSSSSCSHRKPKPCKPTLKPVKPCPVEEDCLPIQRRLAQGLRDVADPNPRIICEVEPCESSSSTSECWTSSSTSECPPPEPSCPICPSSSSSTYCSCSGCHPPPHCRKPRRICRCPSSSSSVLTKCMINYLQIWDFAKTKPIFSGPDQNWEYWSMEEIVADGGTLTFGKNGGFLDTSQYTVTAPQGVTYYKDHYKWFGYANDTIPMISRGKLVFEYVAKVSTNGRGTTIFPFDDCVVSSFDDIRLASGTFRVFDPISGMNFAFHLTNTQIYVVYEREVNYNPPFPNQHYGANPYGFANIIPVMTRTPNQRHNLKIEFDVETKTVSWVVEETVVLKVDKVGHTLNRCSMVKDLGGMDIRSWPKVLQYGFGSMTLLDYYPACAAAGDKQDLCNYPNKRMGLVQTAINFALPAYNPLFGPPKKAKYFDYYSLESSRLWGQGSTTDIRSIKVYNQYFLQYKPGCKR